MVAKIYVECPVCKKITLMRYQMGFLDEHPINFRCGNCEIEIEGKYIKQNIEFYNGKRTTDDDAEFVISCSGELLTNKLKKITSFMDCIEPSPFINATMLMTNEKYLGFKQNVINILKFKNKDAYWVKNINHLYHNNKTELLKKEIIKQFSNRKIPLENRLDIMRVVHNVNTIQYIVLLNKEFEKNSTYIFEQFNKLIKEKRTEVDAYSMFLNRMNILKEWEQKIFKINDKMMHTIESFIPIIGIDYYPQAIEEIKDKYAINTFKFEDVKQLYVDLYELITEMSPLLIGLDNLCMRSGFNEIRIPNNLNNNRIQTLEAIFDNTTKACRLNYIGENEPFEKVVYGKLNQTIRNSIGHFDYDICYSDVFEQTILFKHQKNPQKNVVKSLIEVCYEIWNMYKCVTVFDEILYNMNRIHLNLQGIRASKCESIVGSFNYCNKTIRKGRKIGRNELCPCESGLKYKWCCGKNVD